MTIRFLAPLSASYDTDLIGTDQTMMAAFFAAGAQAISRTGIPLRVIDLGITEDPRYAWREVLPIGSSTQRQLLWSHGAEPLHPIGRPFGAGAAISVFRPDAH